eukprot:365019-Chlamydomonas_euryale.AAC.13
MCGESGIRLEAGSWWLADEADVSWEFNAAVILRGKASVRWRCKVLWKSEAWRPSTRAATRPSDGDAGPPSESEERQRCDVAGAAAAGSCVPLLFSSVKRDGLRLCCSAGCALAQFHHSNIM